MVIPLNPNVPQFHIWKKKGIRLEQMTSKNHPNLGRRLRWGRGSLINIVSIFQGKKYRLREIRPQVAQLINSRALLWFSKLKVYDFSIPPHRLSTLFRLPGGPCTTQSEMAHVCELASCLHFFLPGITSLILYRKKGKKSASERSTEHPGNVLDAALFERISSQK